MSHYTSRWIVAPLMAAVLFSIAACGGDDGHDEQAIGSFEETGDRPAGEAAESAGEEGGESSGDCAGTNLDFTNEDAGVTGTATTALAESNAEGTIYTTYIADFEIDESDLTTWRPEVPDGNNVIEVLLTVFNATTPLEPVEAGDDIAWTSELDQLTFVVRHFTSDEEWGETLLVGEDDIPRHMTVTGVGDTFCFEIEFSNQDKQISGHVEAPVFRRK